MNKTADAVEMSDERIAEIKAWPIDCSDIPEMTREELEHSLVRFPNQPIGRGGEWHKPVIPQSDDVTDEELEQMRMRFWQMAGERQPILASSEAEPEPQVAEL